MLQQDAQEDELENWRTSGYHWRSTMEDDDCVGYELADQSISPTSNKLNINPATCLMFHVYNFDL